MKTKLLIVLALVCSFLFASAQQRNVTGKITDEATNETLPGVTVTVPGVPNAGVTTNANGVYSIMVPQSATQLEFRSIGYGTKTLPITGAVVNVTLTAEVNTLTDVVVIGYGTQKKKDLTGAIATVSGETLQARQTVQVSESLQGSVPGVTVTRNSGAPGSGATVRVRGVTTINNNNALVVVDGIPVSSMDVVNPSDIESISVLKDAASASIYGSRGAAGVILITTKRAGTGKPSLNYNYEFGLQRPNAQPEYVDAVTYMKRINEQFTNDGGAAPYTADVIDNFDRYLTERPDQFPFSQTDWQDLIFTRNLAPRQQHDFNFMAGTDKIKTKVSLGYQDVGSYVENYNYNRYQLRINNNVKISDKFDAVVDLGMRTLKSTTPPVNPFYEARVMPPIYAAYYTNGTYSFAKDGRNPVAELNEGGLNTGRYNQLQGKMALNYKPITDLTLSAILAPTFDFDKSKNFRKKISFVNPDGTATNYTNTPLTNLAENRQESYQLTSQFLANYNKKIGNHQIGATLGYEGVYNSFESLDAARSGFALTDFPYLTSGSTAQWTNNGSANESALRSFFGRVTYDYDGKYLFQANLRNDQSSRFAKEFRSAYFPSFSAGWVVTEEEFMKDAKWLNFLKVRGSYGSVGNERIGNYPYQASIDFTTALLYQGGVMVPVTGGGQQVYAVTDISWETTRSTDFGIDATLLDNRLSVTADYYEKKTTDILLGLDIPLNLGYDKPQQNAGVLNVKGWELGLNWKDKIDELSYSVGFNLSDSKTKMGNMGGTQIIGDQSTFEGSQFNEWYGYRTTGIYQTAADAQASPRTVTTVTAGDLGYVDTNNDGKIDGNDRVLLGGSLPRYEYGGNVNLAYKGFDLTMSFQGVAKRTTRLSNDIVRPFLESFGNFPKLIDGKYWSNNNTPEQNLAAQYPRLTNTNSNNNYALSDFWLMSGAYFRMKNATLGYTFANNDVFKSVGLSSVRVYVAANDFLTLSKYPKYADPETGNATYPIATTFLFGASVKF